MLERIISLIAPHHCIICRTEGSLLCPPCYTSVPSISGADQRPLSGTEHHSPALDSLLCATPYEGAARQLIHGLKFERQKAAARIAAEIMTTRCGPLRADAICYVPTALSRVRQRGYDQAKLIAGHVAKSAGIPCIDALARHGHSRQVGSSRTLRQHQMSAVFQPRWNVSLTDKRIILIDDVFTTGATMDAAAKVLREAGAARVYGLTFAKVPESVLTA